MATYKCTVTKNRKIYVYETKNGVTRRISEKSAAIRCPYLFKELPECPHYHEYHKITDFPCTLRHTIFHTREEYDDFVKKHKKRSNRVSAIVERKAVAATAALKKEKIALANKPVTKPRRVVFAEGISSPRSRDEWKKTRRWIKEDIRTELEKLEDEKKRIEDENKKIVRDLILGKI